MKANENYPGLVPTQKQTRAIKLRMFEGCIVADLTEDLNNLKRK